MTYLEANALVDDFSFVYKGKSIPKEALIECREVIRKAMRKVSPFFAWVQDNCGGYLYD